MRKYWYYTYKSATSFGSGISVSDDGEFDILRAMYHIKEKHHVDATIDSWHEISSSQYEKLNEFYDKQK